MYGACIPPIYIKVSSWPNLPKSFPGGSLVGDRERKDIHLSLSPELLYKAGKLPPNLRQMFKSSSTKKVLVWLLTPDSETSGQPKRHWAGGTVCAVSSQTLSCSLFLPSLTLMCRHRQTQSGWDMQ